ncbi:MAG: hypothetical protein ACTHKE_12595 [Sphingomicrobium sp.]
MANVFVEPRPKSREEGAAITGYVVESADGDIASGQFNTQELAIEWAKKQGHKPLVARVRHLTDRDKPDQWRSA